MNQESVPQDQMVNLTIDGKAIQVPKGTTVYNAAKQMGINIPIFCYLDRMPPFGACRMCLVEVEKMSKPQASCTLEVSEGMIVKTQSALAEDARKEIIEFLLLNHPLDCPICDRGGECPLQENAMNCGSGTSRFYEEKRHFTKPLPLGPVLMLDRERCIICARCTRFGDLLAGDHALEFIERGYKTEVGTVDEGTPESKFIGNTIMICPVGALTSQVYRFRARPWDNEPTESTCTLCPVGCSLILDSRDGEIMRTRSKENRNVNDIWLCDKGWFGYEFTSHPDRLTKPLMRRQGNLETASWEEAISFIATKIQDLKSGEKLAAFGGNPLTFEENYLFQKLMRQCIGVNHVDYRIGMPIMSLEQEGIAPGMEMSIGECEELNYIILLGLDLTEEFPVVWLRLRQAINKGAAVIFMGHFAPEISPYLTKTMIHPPGQEVEMLKQYFVEMIALKSKGKKGAIFVGSQYLMSPHRRAILSQLIKLQQTTKDLTLNLMEGRGNSLGARLAGMHPDLAPFGEMTTHPGMNALQVMQIAAEGGWDFLYVAGSNPAEKFPSKVWKKARSQLGCLVVQEIFLTETAKQADVVLPALTFVEKGGSFINIEGRVQTLLPGKEVPSGLFSDGDIFKMVAKKLGFDLEVGVDVSHRLEEGRLPLTRPVRLEVNPASEKNVGGWGKSFVAVFTHILFDHGVRMKHDEHLVGLVKEPVARLNVQEGERLGIRNGEIVKITANGNSIFSKVKLEEWVAEKTIVLPLGFPKEIPVQELGMNLMNGMMVEISKT